MIDNELESFWTGYKNMDDYSDNVNDIDEEENAIRQLIPSRSILMQQLICLKNTAYESQVCSALGHVWRASSKFMNSCKLKAQSDVPRLLNTAVIKHQR